MSDMTAEEIRLQLLSFSDDAMALVRIGEFGTEMPVEKVKYRQVNDSLGIYIIQGESTIPGTTNEQKILYIEGELQDTKDHAKELAQALLEMYNLRGEDSEIDRIFHRVECYVDMY